MKMTPESFSFAWQANTRNEAAAVAQRSYKSAIRKVGDARRLDDAGDRDRAGIRAVARGFADLGHVAAVNVARAARTYGFGDTETGRLASNTNSG